MRKLNSAIRNILLEQENKKSQEKRIGTYQTKYFYICPGAQTAFPKIEKEIGGRAAAELAQLADNIFAIEAKVMGAGGTNDEAIQSAKNLYNNLMGAAQKAGVANELDFMKGHIDIIENPTEDNKLKEARFNKNRTVVENICNNLINQSLNELHEARVDPAIRLGRSMDRQRKRREWLRGDFDAEGSVEAGPVVSPQTSAQQADFATHEAEQIAATRHSKDPNVRRTQRRAETPAEVTTSVPGARGVQPGVQDPDRHWPSSQGDPVAYAQSTPADHNAMTSRISNAGGIHAGDHADHGIVAQDLGGDRGERHEGYIHTSEQGTILQPHEVSLGDSVTHAFFPQDTNSYTLGKDLSPAKARRLHSSEGGELNNHYGIPEVGVNESRTPKRNYTAQELQEAALNRIKNIGKTQKSYNAHPGRDRF